ncbi:hypothetical protein [Aquimarina sp. 2201CG14-23]|uniref:hypothetical protein n=1 Tax=Aquimarina mycalae TaxID=3040073 RepID=UPI0024782DC9|nr:hypothetical protein [Aquimarina sp. 2201CG14-23]MDH7444650.1 hypothetical protein [Aquimarina sp. 2201CG14-23]
MVILSGLILFSDKVTDFGLTESYGFKSTKTFIWVFTQSLSPLLLCAGAYLKAYRISYTAPVYFYFIQMYWVFNAKALGFDDVLLHVYAFGFCIFSFITLYGLIKVLNYLSRQNEILLKNIRKLTAHIAINIRNKYIPKDQLKEYTKDTVNVVNDLE